MRPRRSAALALFLALLSSGCLLSLQPLYTDRDVVFDPALVGVWTDDQSTITWDCRREGDQGYRATFTDEKGRRAAFVVHLVKIGKERFLDILPDPSDQPLNPLLTDYLFPMHGIVRLIATEPKLRLAALDAGWVSKFLTGNPRALKHERRGNDFILTASTRDLQRFVAKHVTTPGAFAPPAELKRSHR